MIQKEVFSERLKAAMKKQNLKQIDLVRAAQVQGIKLGKSHIFITSHRKYTNKYSIKEYFNIIYSYNKYTNIIYSYIIYIYNIFP